MEVERAGNDVNSQKQIGKKKKNSWRVNEATRHRQVSPDGKGSWRRAVRAGQGHSWGLEDYKATGEEQREFKGSRSEGHVKWI